MRKRVTALGGSVTVESEPGKGARFTLRMPQSLSLMKVLLVRIDEDVYGIPAVDVDSVGRLDPKDITEVAGIRAVRYRGRLLPVVALGPLLSLNGGPRSKRPLVAYVIHGNEGAAVVVDGLHGEREVAVKAPGALPEGHALRDGRGGARGRPRRAPPLHARHRVGGAPARVAGHEPRPRSAAAADPARRRQRASLARQRPRSCARSDTRSTRRWTARTAGRSSSRARYHLLVTDVQMPVLDGIDLTRRVKATPRFTKLPIVIMSSLSAPEERRRGVDAGADAYIVKGELDAESLAATLERLCGVGG